MVKLIAKASFPYNGRSFTAGDLVEALSERDAEILRLLGKAEDAPRLRRKDLTAASTIPSSTRTYRRRDLVAEPAEPTE